MLQSERRPSGPCPTFFRALCRTAQDGRTGGYKWAGYGLAGAITSLVPDDVENDEWGTRLEALDALLTTRDDDGALAWFDQELPRCMALVPRTRRHQFLRGVYMLVIDEDHDITSM